MREKPNSIFAFATVEVQVVNEGNSGYSIIKPGVPGIVKKESVESGAQSTSFTTENGATHTVPVSSLRIEAVS